MGRSAPQRCARAAVCLTNRAFFRMCSMCAYVCVYHMFARPFVWQMCSMCSHVFVYHKRVRRRGVHYVCLTIEPFSEYIQGCLTRLRPPPLLKAGQLQRNYLSLNHQLHTYTARKQTARRWPDHQGNPHIRESFILASVGPRMQAAVLQCLKLRIAVAFPDLQTRAFPGTELSRKTIESVPGSESP